MKRYKYACIESIGNLTSLQGQPFIDTFGVVHKILAATRGSYIGLSDWVSTSLMQVIFTCNENVGRHDKHMDTLRQRLASLSIPAVESAKPPEISLEEVEDIEEV